MLLAGATAHGRGDAVWQGLVAWKVGCLGNPVFGRLAHNRFLKPEHFMKNVLSLCGWIGKLGSACWLVSCP